MSILSVIKVVLFHSRPCSTLRTTDRMVPLLVTEKETRVLYIPLQDREKVDASQDVVGRYPFVHPCEIWQESHHIVGEDGSENFCPRDRWRENLTLEHGVALSWQRQVDRLYSCPLLCLPVIRIPTGPWIFLDCYCHEITLRLVILRFCPYNGNIPLIGSQVVED